MKVYVHPGGDDACGFYRMTEPARVLADQGADVSVERELEWRFAIDGDGRPTRLLDHIDADVVVIQRPLRRWKADMVRCLQAAGVAVVVEIDDDFGSIHQRNAAWPDAHPQWMREDEARARGLACHERLRMNDTTWWRMAGEASHQSNVWLTRACRHADLVTVTTPALAERYAPHGRVAVLPNLVPESYLSIEGADRKGTVVGWGGTRATHPDDLEVTGGAVARAVAATGARLAVVGDGVGVADALGHDAKLAVSGWVPFGRWPRALAGFDVGIVPLAPSRFNDAKSALKLCEMAAVGCAVVASPTPDNVRMAGLGVGRLASTPQEWELAVMTLAASSEIRADDAGRNREAMAAFTYERQAGRWWSAWERALANRQSERAVAA